MATHGRLGNGTFTVTNAVIDMNRFGGRNIEIGQSFSSNLAVVTLVDLW